MTTFAGWKGRRAAATWRIEAGTAVVTLHGELDIDAVPAVRDTLRTAAAAAPDLVLDLSQVGFADSSVLNLVLWARITLGPRLAGPLPAQLARLFDIAGTDVVRSSFPDVTAALAAGRSQVPDAQPLPDG
ncbi:STAS domain-containing protein [Streptomyces indicus]|uniref:Anti-anti-sigma factor n=1 Tax=Streptomyces indicus TaxID=417292 RepID=A0A1G8T4M6_9ACTN|nr:STAS domain-containing protein [Streptomyces indicus]SDJ36367.1 anti-anti-sigma factor [Streptomyces indicus]